MKRLKSVASKRRYNLNQLKTYGFLFALKEYLNFKLTLAMRTNFSFLASQSYLILPLLGGYESTSWALDPEPLGTRWKAI